MAANDNKANRPGRICEAQASVTRPTGNTTQYTEGDAISDNATTATAAGVFAFTFPGLAGSGGQFVDFVMHKDDHDVTTATFWLLLFDAIPAFTGFEDNVACGITDAEMLTCKGTVVFPKAGWVNVITGDVQTVQVRIGFVPVANTIYGILVAGEAYTPADGEKFTITAHATQD